MKNLSVIVLVWFCQFYSVRAELMPLSWNDHSQLATNATISALNAQANGSSTNDTERSKAIFALFANYIKPGQTAAEVHRVLTDTTWLDHAYFYGVYDLAGWVPVEMTSEDTVFCLGLFPHKKKWSDWPSASAAPHGVLADTEPQTDWVIYFRLSGWLYRRKEDALAFLRGAPVTGNPKIVEFALCYPHPTSPDRLVGRIERFGVHGIHVYDPWREDRPTTDGTKDVPPISLRR